MEENAYLCRESFRELKQTTTTMLTRERHQAKGLTSRTTTVHVRYTFLNISLPSFAEQEREMTKFDVV